MSKLHQPEYDDRLRSVETAPRKSGTVEAARGRTGFVLARIQVLEKPGLEEALIEPGAENPCQCNTVCTCVPVQSCACFEVCTCDTVNSCPSYCACIGNCCVGVYWMPCV